MEGSLQSRRHLKTPVSRRWGGAELEPKRKSEAGHSDLGTLDQELELNDTQTRSPFGQPEAGGAAGATCQGREALGDWPSLRGLNLTPGG